MVTERAGRLPVWLQGLLVVVCASVAVAGQASPIEPFALATVESQHDLVSPAHRVLLSPVREVNHEIRADSMIRPTVNGFARLLRINDDSSRREARDYYLTQLSQRNAQILFQCSGRGCGRSNVWANQIFGQATLYGNDEDQDYVAAAYRAADGMIQLVLVYTVTRGNQREYAWVEQLAVAPDTTLPGFNDGAPRMQGPVVVPWAGGVTYQFQWSADTRRQLQEWADQTGSRVVLVSYSALGSTETLESALARARKAADSMTSLLVKSGIAREQLTTLVVGPVIAMADPERQGNRIELLVVRQP